MSLNYFEIGKLYKFNKEFISMKRNTTDGSVYFLLKHDKVTVKVNKTDFFTIVEENDNIFLPTYLVLISGHLVVIKKDFLKKYAEIVDNE